jgi:hypothetical protein
MLGVLIPPIFHAENLDQARDRLSEAVPYLEGGWARSPRCNPLERFNKEIGRRTDVVGIFPNDAALIRLAGMLCIEQNDEWLVGRGYLSAESISDVLGPEERNSQHGRTEKRRQSPSERRGRQAPTGLSRTLNTDELSAPLLHHDPGLGFVEPLQRSGRC